MLVIDQFIYTTALIEGKKGYQIVAKSSGISLELISELNPYLYPLGMTSSEFNESNSLLVLKTGKIAFSKIKNSGMGYDGRSNTIYNHTLVMDIEDFKKISNDSRILERYYVEDPTLQGELPQLKIEGGSLADTIHLTDDVKKHLHEIMHALFNKNKIALFPAKNPEFIQNILSLVPPSMRLISFSTLVIQPDQQQKYNFILTKKSSKSFLGKEFKIIDLDQQCDIKEEKILFCDSIDYFINVLNSQNMEKIKQFHEQFEMISGNDFEMKLSLLFYLDSFENCLDKSEQQNISDIIMDLLIKFEPKSVFFIYRKIRDSLSPNKIHKYVTEFEIPQILSDFESISIEKESIEKMLNKLSNGTSDSRQKLLAKLIDKRKEDFLKNGSFLIVQTRNSYYNLEIYRVFIEINFLHKCIFDTLDVKNDIKDYIKTEIFEIFFMLSSKYCPELIPPLLNYDVFILEDQYDVWNFKKLLEKSLDSDVIKNINVDILFMISKKIFFKIREPTKSAKPSGSIELQDSVLRYLVEIAEYIVKWLDFILQNPELSKNQQNEVRQLKVEIQYFIKEKKVNEVSDSFWF